MKVNTLKFKELLVKKNIRQAELARKLEIAPQNLSNFLTKGDIPIKHKDNLFRILGDDLIDTIESKETFYIHPDNTEVNESSGIYGTDNSSHLIKEINYLKAQLDALKKLLDAKERIISMLDQEQK